MAIAGALHGLRTRAGYNVGIKLEGDWVRYEHLMNTFGPAIMALAQQSQKNFAKKYKTRVRHHIRTGGKRFGYPGHSPKYRSYKQRRGGGSRVLYWGGTMYNSVDIMDLPRGRTGVGIPTGIYRPRYPREKGDLLSVSEYANILEHGTRGGLHIPARPVFSDTFKKDMKGMKGLKEFMALDIYAKARAQGINITKL